MNKLIKYLALLSFSITTNVMAAGVPVFNFYELWALQELNHAKIDSSNIISVNYPCSITYLVNTNVLRQDGLLKKNIPLILNWNF